MKLTTELLKKIILSEIQKVSEEMSDEEFIELDKGDTLHSAVKDAGYEPDPMGSINVNKQKLMKALMAKGLSAEQAQDLIDTVASTSDVRDLGNRIEYK